MLLVLFLIHDAVNQMKVHQGRRRLNQKKNSTIFIVSNKWLIRYKIQKGCKRIEFFFSNAVRLLK